MVYSIQPVAGKFQFIKGIVECQLKSRITFQCEGLKGKRFQLFLTHYHEDTAKQHFIRKSDNCDSAAFRVVPSLDESYQFGKIAGILGEHPYYTGTADSDQIVLQFLSLGSDKVNHLNHRMTYRDNIWNLHFKIDDETAPAKHHHTLLTIQVLAEIRKNQSRKRAKFVPDPTTATKSKKALNVTSFSDKELLANIYQNIKYKCQNLDRPALLKLYYASLELFPCAPPRSDEVPATVVYDIDPILTIKQEEKESY